MTDKEPERLKATGETPEQLVRALRALGRDRDSARLARVAERLAATLAASGAPSGGGLHNVLGSKLALMSVVLGLGALGVLGYQLASNSSAPIESPAAPMAEPDAPSAPQPATPRVHSDSDKAAVPPVDEHEPAAPAVLEAPRSKRPPKHGLGVNADQQARTANAAPAAEAAPAQPVDDAEQVPSPAAVDEPKPAASAPAPPPPSEELLVYRARKVAASDPAAALKLLDEHAARFPSGTLVPEREVLAIEVLRALGRGKEAEQRLQRFEARYPKSIHLRRLEQGRRSVEHDD